MTDLRQISTRTLLLLGLGSGLAIGLLAGRTWSRQVEESLQRERVAVADRLQRLRDPVRWARDSATLQERFRAFPTTPRFEEVARTQLETDCLVTSALPDTLPAFARLFQGYATGHLGTLIARGMVYLPDGLPPGHRIGVVFQNIRCTDVSSIGYGWSPGPASGVTPRAP